MCFFPLCCLWSEINNKFVVIYFLKRSICMKNPAVGLFYLHFNFGEIAECFWIFAFVSEVGA